MTKENTNKSAYGDDKFVPAQPTLPFMVVRVPPLKTHLEKALDFSRKQEGYEVLRTNDEVEEEDPENAKRFRKKDLKLSDMKKENWFLEIFKDVNARMQQIHPNLEINKFEILKSIEGCPQQDFHTDNDPKEKQKQYSIIFSLMKGTSMVFKEANDIDGFGYWLQMPEASMVIFRANEAVHAGGSYNNEENYRFFFKASPKKKRKKRRTNLTMTKKRKETPEFIHIEQTPKVDVYLCPACTKEVESKRGTSNYGEYAKKKHAERCVKYLRKVDGMTKEEALKQRKDKLKKGRAATRKCRQKKEEAKLKAEQMSKEKTEEEAEESKEDKEGANKKRVRNEGGGNEVRQNAKRTKRKAEE